MSLQNPFAVSEPGNNADTPTMAIGECEFEDECVMTGP